MSRDLVVKRSIKKEPSDHHWNIFDTKKDEKLGYLDPETRAFLTSVCKKYIYTELEKQKLESSFKNYNNCCSEKSTDISLEKKKREYERLCACQLRRCSVCNIIGKKDYMINHHRARMHKKNKPNPRAVIPPRYHCMYCSLGFISEAGYFDHITQNCPLKDYR